jgi:cupin fold WbuC family metalloprotein
MFGMKIIDNKLLDHLSAQAKENPRSRQNLNLHSSSADPSQRLLNAIEPASYVRPHRHLHDPKPESFIALRGRLALLIFADDGQVKEVILIGPREDVFGVDLPAGIWHSVVCLEENTVFYETKPGPYMPVYDKDFAPWAPEADTAEAAGYLEGLRALIVASSAGSRGGR